MKHSIIFIFLLFVFQNSFSQKQLANSGGYTAVSNGPKLIGDVRDIKPTTVNKSEPCGTKSMSEHLREDPSYRPVFEKMIGELLLNGISNNGAGVEGNRLIIPVVFHRINGISTNKLSSDEADLHHILKILNEDFRGVTLNNTGGEGAVPLLSDAFDWLGWDSSVPFAGYYNYSIEFRLVEKNPVGNVTSGIETYVFPDDSDVFVNEDYANNPCDLTEELNLDTNSALNSGYGKMHWFPESYLNIYIVNEIVSLEDFSGNAHLPYFIADEPCRDAIFMADFAVDKTDNNFCEHCLTHEVGHWLGLEHVWGGYETDICDHDDFKEFIDYVNTINTDNDDENDIPLDVDDINRIFNDTPLSGATYDQVSSCDGLNNLCDSYEGYFQNDMWDNFLNYGSCRTTFSKGQVRLMKCVLDSDIADRNNLYSLENLTEVFNCIEPMPVDINYKFNRNNPNPEVVSGVKSMSIFAPNYEGQQVSYFYKKYTDTNYPNNPVAVVDGLEEVELTDLDLCSEYSIKMEYDCVYSVGGNNYTNNYTIERTIFYGSLFDCEASKKESTTSIEKLTQSINIYPNPSEGIFSVNVEDIDKVTNFSLTDITGRKTTINSVQKSQNTLEFDATDLDMGYYILTVIYTNGERASSKLVIN